jgi:hypothetical protein
MLQQEGIIKDLILGEYARMRHDYNNMLQTLTNLIEEEDITALKEYQTKLFEKAQAFHNNNILQLEKLRNLSILNTIYRLYMESAKSGITLNIAISGKVEQHYPYEDDLYPILIECLNTVYSSQSDTDLLTTLELRESQRGLIISFITQIELYPNNSKPYDFKYIHPKSRKRLSYNIIIKDNIYIQEILIPL